MENDDKRKDGQEIDEQHLMSIMAGGTSKVSLVKEVESLQEKQVPKERSKSKRSLDEAYGERFLNTHTMTKRGDKSIYIRSEYHERLSRIVQVIGEDRIPLYAYLDNILEHHFDLFEKAITDDFNKKYKPIF